MHKTCPPHTEQNEKGAWGLNFCKTLISGISFILELSNIVQTLFNPPQDLWHQPFFVSWVYKTTREKFSGRKTTSQEVNKFRNQIFQCYTSPIVNGFSGQTILFCK